MKLRHNKKRNTAFLYEALIKEFTKAIVNQNTKAQKDVKNILKEFFMKSSPLSNELAIYNELLSVADLNESESKRLMFEVKQDYQSIDKKAIFNEQTKLLKKIHENLSSKLFSAFLSNYRDIATVGQFLNSETLAASQRIVVENKVFDLLTSSVAPDEKLHHIDNLTLKTFTNKFNETYKHSLKEEQKTLLTHYITSFSDNGIGLKSFMNEELGRLKKEVKLLSESTGYGDNFNKILTKLDNYVKVPINESMIKEVFYIQDLLHEVKKDVG